MATCTISIQAFYLHCVPLLESYCSLKQLQIQVILSLIPRPNFMQKFSLGIRLSLGSLLHSGSKLSKYELRLALFLDSQETW